MPENSFVPLPGSDRQPVAGAQPGRDLDDATQIEVTLVTRRREALPTEVVTGPATLSRDELAARHGTDPSDLALIRDVLGRFGLTVAGSP
jgi:kumamolisin